ncbi:hypothetical protein BHE74_00001368 [Ensete ventricosum]|nr:hypothetical protein BHE74_00001368 [Ensete ventricosum]
MQWELTERLVGSSLKVSEACWEFTRSSPKGSKAYWELAISLPKVLEACWEFVGSLPKITIKHDHKAYDLIPQSDNLRHSLQ